MPIRAKAPLRLGLAGGGTDVSPYCDIYGGCILNACINMYAHATIVPRHDDKIEFCCDDVKEYIIYNSTDLLEIDGKFDLLKGVYNRIVRDYTKKRLSFSLRTYADAPAGSGLGSSSTLVVAIVSAFAQWLNLPLTEYELANLAWSIEREDLKMCGGRQDQYAAAFGGFNFMEFNGDKVLVNPLRIKDEYINELEHNLVLYYTGTSRLSADIIKKQIDNVNNNNEYSIDAMHNIKKQAYDMKEALLTGNINKIGALLHDGWENKKKMTSEITNSLLDEIYDVAIKSGASGGKITGAGGGGYFIFYCPGNSKYKVIEQLEKFGGKFEKFCFSGDGAKSWISK